MLFERDKVYPTRGGTLRRVVCTDAPGRHPIVTVPANRGDAGPEAHTEDGRVYKDPSLVHPLDLMPPAPVKRDGWVAVFKAVTGSGHIVSEEVFTSKEHAEHETAGAVAIVRIEWEETP